ncbi:MAG: hypothetical protein R2867_04405 [Caldilineaceae bacterium]
MLDITDADHEESSPQAATRLISHITCSIAGQEQIVQLVADSQVAALYGDTMTTEDFLCNYGFNRGFTAHFQKGDLRFVGFDADGELRAIELPGHPFYIATLYLPQMRSQPGQPHPLIMGYLRAAGAMG